MKKGTRIILLVLSSVGILSLLGIIFKDDIQYLGWTIQDIVRGKIQKK